MYSILKHVPSGLKTRASTVSFSARVLPVAGSESPSCQDVTPFRFFRSRVTSTDKVCPLRENSLATTEIRGPMSCNNNVIGL